MQIRVRDLRQLLDGSDPDAIVVLATDANGALGYSPVTDLQPGRYNADPGAENGSEGEFVCGRRQRSGVPAVCLWPAVELPIPAGQ
jgi:hypothetical protein